MSSSNTVVELKAIAKSLGLKGYSTLRKDELIDLINFEHALIPDITQNVLSDYIEYDELKALQNKISGLKIDPNRIKVVEEFDDNNILYQRETFIDGDLRKREEFEDGNKKLESNYINDKKEGEEFRYNNGFITRNLFHNGNIISTSNYRNGIKEGDQILYDENEYFKKIDVYQNGILVETTNYEIDSKGKLKKREEYKNGVLVESTKY